jgi:hypothetical protein
VCMCVCVCVVRVFVCVCGGRVPKCVGACGKLYEDRRGPPKGVMRVIRVIRVTS